MTLIVGILCENGAVVASDGAATLGSFGRSTARQGVKKLSSVADRVIVGVSGPVGLGQLILDQVQRLNGKGEFSRSKCKSKEDAMRLLRGALWDDIQQALQQAQAAVPVVGNKNAAQSAVTTTLVAMDIRGAPHLIQLDHQCAPEAASPDLPFVAIGSGQPQADPFLGFLRRVFWPNRLPKLSEGILVAVWTLFHVIDIHPGGVSNPMQVMVLDDDGGVTEMDEHELGEHRQNVAAAEAYISRFPKTLSGDDDEEVEAPPEPE